MATDEQGSGNGGVAMLAELLTVDHHTRMVDNRPEGPAALGFVHQEDPWDSM